MFRMVEIGPCTPFLPAYMITDSIRVTPSASLDVSSSLVRSITFGPTIVEFKSNDQIEIQQQKEV